jgi:hypothetical protein
MIRKKGKTKAQAKTKKAPARVTTKAKSVGRPKGSTKSVAVSKPQPPMKSAAVPSAKKQAPTSLPIPQTMLIELALYANALGISTDAAALTLLRSALDLHYLAQQSS